MTGDRSLLVGVSDLLARPGRRRPVHLDAALGELATSTATIVADAPVLVDLVLESQGGSITAAGTLEVHWAGECRRCLEAVEGVTEAEVREVFEPHPVEGETYPLDGETIDLGPMVRDAAVLALPLAPLCRPDCAGPAPDAFPTGPPEEADDVPAPRDPRWAALDELRFES
jgi:uncharacterized protein